MTGTAVSSTEALTLQSRQRMPLGFGPAPGPRNVPVGVPPPSGPERRTTFAFAVPVRAADIEPLVPDGVSLAGETMTVSVQKLANLRWLAGRGYDIVSVSVPVRWRDAGDEVVGDYLAVLWENLAEPIVTGRDELGFPKLFADIEAPPYEPGRTSARASAGWDGTTFFTAAACDLAAAPPASSAPRPVLTRRYLPAVGRPDGAEVDHLTVTDTSARPALTVLASATGSGEVGFWPVSWQQVPVQYPVINTLAAIRQSGPVTVQVTCVEGRFSAVGNRRLSR